MVKQLRFAAVPLIAGAIAGTTIALTTASAFAFSQQTVTPNGNYDFNYSSPDDKTKPGDSTNKFDSGNTNFHFSIDHGPTTTGPFGFRSFGGSDNDKLPDFYAPHGRGD